MSITKPREVRAKIRKVFPRPMPDISGFNFAALAAWQQECDGHANSVSVTNVANHPVSAQTRQYLGPRSLVYSDERGSRATPDTTYNSLLMSSSLDGVRVALAKFLSGGMYMPLWTAVMDATTIVDANPNVSDDEREWYDELYDAVYMAAEDPVDDKSAKDGIIGAAELRLQIRAMQLDRFD